LLFGVIGSLGIFFSRAIYFKIWTVTTPIFWLLYIVIVLELYSLILKDYSGIATFGRWAVMGSLALAIVISVLTLGLDLNHLSKNFPILQYYFVIERGIATSLMVFLLLITAFFIWFPVSMNRNIAVYCLGYFVYFCSKTMMLLFRNVWSLDKIRLVSTVVLGVSCACYLFWIVFLTKAGEKRSVVLGYHWPAGDAQRLLGQLDAINMTLLRSARK
jgi:hypothetical protein